MVEENHIKNKCSDKCNEVLKNKREVFKKFALDKYSFILQQISTYEEYLKTMEIVPLVSRCFIYHNKDFIENLLKEKCFYPIIVKLDPNAANHDEPYIVGYFEIYLLPHLGRTFDARIERVVVHPEYRNYGICQEMIQYGINFCKNALNCNRIDLYSDNERAIHIFSKFGFDLVDTNVYRIYLTD